MNSFLRNLLISKCIRVSTTKRSISTTSALYTFWIRDEKGGYRTQPTPSLKERMRVSLADLRKEVKLWCEELKDSLDGDPILLARPGETDLFFRFRNEENWDLWVVSSDSDHNEGFSTCSLTRNMYGNAVFSGNVNLQVPKDGKIKRAGYCNIKTKQVRKSFKRDTYYDWTNYNTLVMKVRGDGRTYLLNLHSKGTFDITWNDVFHYQLYTRGGPYWQIAKIPFSKFFMASRGRIQDNQAPIRADQVSAFGLSVQDRHGGDFCLEIDYIGLEYDPRHVEEFAYEEYQLESGIANV